MTYRPESAIALDSITTSEQLSGRLVDGVASYVKLIKQAGALGTGDVSIAHGITGLTRVVTLEAAVQDATPQWIAVPFPQCSTTGVLFGLSISYVDSTNVHLYIGTGWGGANALSEAWIVMEYLK